MIQIQLIFKHRVKPYLQPVLRLWLHIFCKLFLSISIFLARYILFTLLQIPDCQSFEGFFRDYYLRKIVDFTRAYSDRLTAIDSLLGLSLPALKIEALQLERLSILENLRKKTWQAGLLQASLNLLIAEKSEKLLDKNNATSLANILETNYRDVSGIWLETVGLGKPELLFDHADTLFDIAHQCPYDGGWAVYWARGLYSYLEDLTYDDEQLCPASRERTGASASLIEPSLFIMPNPAKDNVSLSWTFKNSSDAFLIITNAFQQQVFSAPAYGSSLNLDVKAFQSGVYYAFVVQAGEKTLSRPFIVIK